MKKKPLYGLVCTGGGAHGAYQVGVLKYIHEKFCHGDKSPFQIFAGSSCGSLNTSFFAAQSHNAHKARLMLEELWLRFHIPSYHGSILKSALLSLYHHWHDHDKQPTWSLLDPTPMEEIVKEGFKRSNLAKAFEKKTTQGVAVAATELITGRACWFQDGPNAKTWNLFHSIGIKETLCPEHLWASCSVPVFMPPVKIGHLFFLDGSVSLRRPLSAAISMGATRILSIGTEKPMSLDLPSYNADYKPHFSDVIRMLIHRLSRDSSSDEAVQLEMFNRFHRALARKNRKARLEEALPLFHKEAMPAHYQPPSIFLFYPSKRIRKEGVNGKPLTKKERKGTRFMFHKKFIGELIQMGYEDAKSRHSELKDFFDMPERQRKWFFFSENPKKYARRDSNTGPPA